MANNTQIEWTGASWNSITGRSVLSPGCINCYAMKLAGGWLRHHPSRSHLDGEPHNGMPVGGMNMFAQYDRAIAALASALKSTQVDAVLLSRDELDHIKLRARRVRDRELLADATEFQTRVKRWLGVLMGKAKEAGHLREGRSATIGGFGTHTSKLSIIARHTTKSPGARPGLLAEQ